MSTTNGKNYGAVKDATAETPVASNGGGSGGSSNGANISKIQKLATQDSSQLQQAPRQQQHQQHSVFGIAFIMLGAFSFSIMFLLVKVMKDANTFTLVFYRSIVQIVISLGTILYEGQNPLGPPDGSARFYLVCRAVFGAAAVCMWFFGIQILPLPDAVTLQFTTPPFAAAFAVCMVGETWLPLDIIGAVVCLTGVALIAHPTWLFGAEAADDEAETEDGPSVLMQTLAVLVTTGGAAFAGIAYVCVRKIGEQCSADVMVLYYGALSIPMTIIGSGLLLGEWNVWGGPTAEFTALDWFFLLLMGFGGYGGQLFTNIGLQKETAATATLATSTQIVWTYIFELCFLHEAINGWSIAGTGLILGYMLFVGALKLCAPPPPLPLDGESPEIKNLLLKHSSSGASDDLEKGRLLHQNSL